MRLASVIEVAATSWECASRRSVERGPLIIGKLDPIGDVPADRKPCDPRNGKRVNDNIAETESCPRFRRERLSKALGAMLFGVDVAAQASLVVCKRLLISAARG